MNAEEKIEEEKINKVTGGSSIDYFQDIAKAPKDKEKEDKSNNNTPTNNK